MNRKSEEEKNVISLTAKISKETDGQFMKVCKTLNVTRSEGVRRCIQAVYASMKLAEGRSNNGTQITS